MKKKQKEEIKHVDMSKIELWKDLKCKSFYIRKRLRVAKLKNITKQRRKVIYSVMTMRRRMIMQVELKQIDMIEGRLLNVFHYNNWLLNKKDWLKKQKMRKNKEKIENPKLHDLKLKLRKCLVNKQSQLKQKHIKLKQMPKKLN